MGGGDLNLKKSWHPHTMRNQEKVWKAEQAKSQEDKKLKDLRREIEEEKTREDLKQIGRNSGILPQEDKKLEWMYKSSMELINREEYLLGRTIDKSFEVLQAEEQRKDQNLVGVKQSINHVEHECIPFSIREYRNLESTEQVDLQRKVMEDPLMLIKQREMESRKKILENPVKLKELHRILKRDQMLKKSKKGKKSKKSKKSKKKHKKRSKASTSEDSSESDSGSDTGKDLDKELAKRYKKLNEQEEFSGLNLTKLLDAKFETLTKELDKAARNKQNKKNRGKRFSSGDSDEDERNRYKESRTNRRQQKRSRSRSSHNSYSRRSRSKSPNKFKNAADRRCDHQYPNPNSRSPNNKHRPQRYTERSPAEPRTRQYSTSPSVEKELKRGAESEQNLKSYSKHEYRVNKIENSSKNCARSNDRNCQGPEVVRSDKKTRSKSPKESRNRRRPLTRSPEKSRKRSISPQHRHGRSGNHSAKTATENSNKHNRCPAPFVERKLKSSQTKLSDTEKEARLRDMMENASWREEDRVKAVKKHREANAREEEQHKKQEFDKEFINKEVKKAISNHSSVGSRIRSNLNNIQRTSDAMNSNFTRK